MRFFNGLVGLLAGTGLCVTGSEILVGCSSDFHGCAETRTCKSASGGDAGSSEDQEAAGAGAKPDIGLAGAPSGVGGKAGAAGKSGGGKGGAGQAEGGAAGEREPTGDAGSETGADNGGAAGEATGAGTGTSGTSAMGGAASTVEEAPHIVSTTPENGAKGVQSKVEITVTFSEPMDNASTEAAFHSNELPPVQLSWRKNNTVLVIQPTQPLVYANVKSPTGDAKFYSFSIAGTATDLGGKPLGDERTFVFTTLRNVTQKLGVSAGRQLTSSPTGATEGSAGCTLARPFVEAGDEDDGTGVGFVITFNYDGLAPGVVTWQGAGLWGNFTQHTRGNPFPRLGSLQAYRVVIDSLADAKYSSSSVFDFGTAASYISEGGFRLDVLDAITTAYANQHTEGGRLAVLFKFEKATDGDGEGQLIDVPCDQLALNLSYTAP